MNHEGSICDNLYVNGTMEFIDFCDKHQMSMFKIGMMVKELEYDMSFPTLLVQKSFYLMKMF